MLLSKHFHILFNYVVVVWYSFCLRMYRDKRFKSGYQEFWFNACSFFLLDYVLHYKNNTRFFFIFPAEFRKCMLSDSLNYLTSWPSLKKKIITCAFAWVKESFNSWSFSKLINWYIKEGASYNSTNELIEVYCKKVLLVIW